MTEHTKKIKKTIEHISLSEKEIREILDARGEDTAVIMGDISPNEKKSLILKIRYFFRDTKNLMTRRIEVVDTIKNLFGSVKEGIVDVGRFIKKGVKRVAVKTGNFLVRAAKFAAICYLIFDAFGIQITDFLKGIPKNIAKLKQQIIDIGTKIKEKCIDIIYTKVEYSKIANKIFSYFSSGAFFEGLKNVLKSCGSLVVDIVWVGLETFKLILPSLQQLFDSIKSTLKIFGAEIKISIPKRKLSKDMLVDQNDTWQDDAVSLKRSNKNLEIIISRLSKKAKENDKIATARLKEIQFLKRYNDFLLGKNDDNGKEPETIENLKNDFEEMCVKMGDTMSSFYKQRMRERLERKSSNETKTEEIQTTTREAIEKSISTIINYGNEIIHESFIVNIFKSFELYKNNFIAKFVNPFWHPLKNEWENFKEAKVKYNQEIDDDFALIEGTDEHLKKTVHISHHDPADVDDFTKLETTEILDEKTKEGKNFTKTTITQQGFTDKKETLEIREISRTSGRMGSHTLQSLNKSINLRDYIPAEYKDNSSARAIYTRDEVLRDKLKLLIVELKRYSKKINLFDLQKYIRNNIILEVGNLEEPITKLPPNLQLDKRTPITTLT